MTPENFCYWLQGLLEIGDPSMLDAKQVLIIKDHLNLVFKKETTTIKNPTISEWLLSDSPVLDKFKITQDRIDVGKPLPDYLRPWSSPLTITC
jgi:hypothetical protein